MEMYKISEVAKKYGITRTALIHYDHCGLLSPSVRNDKNYRFYSQEDMEKLELIIALKESGLTLKEIDAYLKDTSRKTSIELLSQQKEKLDKKIEAMVIQSRVIEERITNLKKFNTITLYDGVLVDDYPALSIITEPIGYGPLMGYDSAINRLKKRLEANGQLTSKFGICYSLINDGESLSIDMKYVFDYLNADSHEENLMQTPSSKYLRCLHKGNRSTVVLTIKRLTDYADKHGYTLHGEAYFVPLFDYWESVSSDGFIGEVLLPVINAG